MFDDGRLDCVNAVKKTTFYLILRYEKDVDYDNTLISSRTRDLLSILHYLTDCLEDKLFFVNMKMRFEI